MGKFKPVKSRKPAVQQRANAIGCIILLVLIFVLINFIIYLSVSQG